MCCDGSFICKDKMNKRNSKILIDAVSIGKKLLEIGVREPNAANIDDALVCLTPASNCQMVFYKNVSGIFISSVFSEDCFSLTSSDSATFLLKF